MKDIWDNPDEARTIFSALIKFRNTEGGWPMTTGVSVLMDGFRSAAKEVIAQTDVMHVCRDVDPGSKDPFADFDKRYRLLIENSSRNYSFELITPLNVSFDFDLSNCLFPIEDRVVKIKRLSDFNEAFKSAKAPGGATASSVWRGAPTEGYVISIEVAARNSHAALAIGMRTLNIFRGIIYMVTSWGSHTIHFGEHKANCKVKHGKWAAAISTDNVWTTSNYVGDSVGDEQYTARSNFGELLSKYVSMINGSEPDYRELLLDLVRLYGHSGEVGDLEKQFLFLWNFLERGSLAQRYGGDTKLVCSRVASTLEGIKEREFPLAVKNSLRRFADMRNEIVHRGATNIVDDDDIHLIKTFGEDFFRFILRCGKSLSTEQELDVFYRMISDKKLDHETMRKVFNVAIDIFKDG